MALVMVITWLDFGAVLLKTVILANFLLKFRMCFFQGQTLFWPYLRNGWSDWCETKTKCIGLILGIICDLDLWLHSWPNSCISGIVGLIDGKWKGSELIWYWADCMTLPLDHTHDHIFRVVLLFWGNFHGDLECHFTIPHFISEIMPCNWEEKKTCHPEVISLWVPKLLFTLPRNLC